jgi:hypothetical protein
VIARATAVLHALARSDTAALDRLCHDDVFIWGTDDDEEWRGKAATLSAFHGAYNLAVRWVGEPIAREQWVAGMVEFDSQDADRHPGEAPVRARVSMVFAGDLLAHAHYSVAR